MPSRQFRLGKLEHIHNNQNLKLKTKISITLSSTEPSPWHSSHVSDIETLVIPKSWIAGGNRFHVHVQFRFDDVMISDLSVRQVIEDIGVMLCSSVVPFATIGTARVADWAADVASAPTQTVS